MKDGNENASKTLEYFEKALQPPKEGESPISFVPIEVLGYILSFVPLRDNVPLRALSTKWLGAWNTELAYQQGTFNEEKLVALWERQSKEMNIFFENENAVLEKTDNAEIVIAEYIKLKEASVLEQGPLSYHAREIILNKINEAIICQHIQKSKKAMLELFDYSELDCTNCCLTRFPASVIQKDIKYWQTLKTLRLNQNHLSVLPENIGECVELRELHAERNQLNSLPESIGNCNKLLGLHIANNQLATLPESIINCVALISLVCSNNKLGALPELGGYTALRWLDVSNNLLLTLPDSIVQCVVLFWLHANNNQLTALPEEIGQCSELKVLFVNENNLLTLPDNLSEDILYIASCRHTTKSEVLAAQKIRAVAKEDCQQEAPSKNRRKLR